MVTTNHKPPIKDLIVLVAMTDEVLKEILRENHPKYSKLLKVVFIIYGVLSLRPPISTLKNIGFLCWKITIIYISLVQFSRFSQVETCSTFLHSAFESGSVQLFRFLDFPNLTNYHLNHLNWMLRTEHHKPPKMIHEVSNYKK